MASSLPRRARSNALPPRRRGRRIARFAARLGLAGILFQALLPLLLAAASLTEAHAAPPDDAQSAIHPHHGIHCGSPAPAPHDGPAGHSHAAAHCILCLGLHAAGAMAVPSAITLVPPRAASDPIGVALATSAQIARPPAPYASRAPPFIG